MKNSLFFILSLCLQVQICVAQDSVKDIEGNSYPTVKIGNQVWMQENLRVSLYNDGTVIKLVSDSVEWKKNYSDNTYLPMMCWYNNDKPTFFANKYGALYNWFAVNTGKLCPTGWHVPSDAEFTELENYLVKNGYNWDGSSTGNKLGKAFASTKDWTVSTKAGDIGCDLKRNNKTLLNVYPTGFRHGTGYFNYIKFNSSIWTSTESNTTNSWYRLFYYANPSIYRASYSNKEDASAVRCIKD